MKNYNLPLFSVLLLFDWSLAAEFSPVIETTKGPVKGLVLTTIRESKKYHSYRGIPYGKPPVDYLRFRAPVEVDPWIEEFDATKDGPICPQIYNETFVGQEDCLNLNVYTPQLPKDGEDTELKAVLYWIYGGSFLRGVASKFYYSPDYLIEEDIVVVTVNYRLGALGFLALQHQNATGNAGLKDQNLGLRWVRDNIAKFGGDPNKVTIAGVGAGSVSVGYHILSEKSKDLFRSSILMNGVPLYNLAFITPDDAAGKAYELAKVLGSTATNDDELLKFYYQVDLESLTRMVTNLSQIDILLKPTLENPNYGPDWFITECVLKLFGNHNRGPYMIGYNNDETIAFAERLEYIRYYINESVPLISEFEREKPEKLDIEKDIANASIYKIIKELEFVAPIDFTQKLLTNFNDTIYYYRYDFGYNKSLHDIIDHFDIDGETRADEIKMIFYSELFQVNPKANNSMTLLQRRMTRLWTNFVKYGNPTPDGTNDALLNIVWPDSRKSGEMLWLNDDLSVHDRYRSVVIDVAEILLEFFSSNTFACVFH